MIPVVMERWGTILETLQRRTKTTKCGRCRGKARGSFAIVYKVTH